MKYPGHSAKLSVPTVSGLKMERVSWSGLGSAKKNVSTMSKPMKFLNM